MANNTPLEKPWTLSRGTKTFFSRSTARTTGYGDMFKTIGALLLLGAAITGLASLAGFVTLTVASVLTVYATAMLIIAVVATFNYCFAAQFMRASLKAHPCVPGKRYGANKNRMDLKAMSAKLITIANKKNSKVQLSPKDLWVGIFKDPHECKISTVYGITLRNAAIFIPTGVLMAHDPKLSEMEVAALMMVEILKIRNAHARRGIVNTIANIGLNFASLIENLDHSSWFLGKFIATIGSPFQLVLLIQKSRNRTHQYEAMDDLIKECGTEFGAHLKEAYIKLGLPWEDLNVKIQPEEPRDPKNFRARVYDEAANTVFHGIKGFKEAFSDSPAAGNVQVFLEEKLNPPPILVLHTELICFKPVPKVAPSVHATHVPAPTIPTEPIVVCLPNIVPTGATMTTTTTTSTAGTAIPQGIITTITDPSKLAAPLAEGVENRTANTTQLAANEAGNHEKKKPLLNEEAAETTTARRLSFSGV